MGLFRYILTWKTDFAKPLVQVKPYFYGLCELLQVAWINEYHRTCRSTIGAVLEKKGQKDALDWLNRETEEL